ncbi:hypothetical protein [Burkholderia sp. B21-005]|uniref:hypothetical protein n=1 Tax=Burkholderia sp. B21-005 TaxID=2890406 RepID=UPI001E44F23B|nr:hypothetical protein [Burkholderia sp. B21-005]UEP43146.1 hypothetical protein LMA02_24040 [Burkholderia sp. B21-005]
MSDEVKEDAAPSSTEPAQAVEQPGEAHVAASDVAASSPVESVSVTLASTDVGSSQPVASSPANEHPMLAAPADGKQYDPATGDQVGAYGATAGQEPVPDSARTAFEQRVEQRFLQVEAFIVKLPHSIAHAFHQGSGSVEELAQRAIAHLFGKDQ